MLVLLMACSPPVDADAAREWAADHDGTLTATEAELERLLAKLPSLPGDRFFCRETVKPPGFEGDEAALRDMLCRQQRPAWDAERHDAEEALGTAELNGAFLQYGVVGVSLSIGSADAVEWADHRGVWQFSDPSAVSAATSGVTLALPTAVAGKEVDGQLGWGLVDTAIDDGEPRLSPAFEWTNAVKRREATATVRLLVLADGTPDVAYVREALDQKSEVSP